MRTSLRLIGWPALNAALAMSAVPDEPNSFPSAPALGGVFQLEVFELGRASLCRPQILIGLRFEFVALRFELGDIRRRRHGGPAGGHQEIPRVTRLHLDPIADLAEVR